MIDDTTVAIHLTAPYGPFLNALAGRFALIVDKSLYEEIGEDAYNEAPVGTGPYKFVSRVSGDRITLEANEEYWGGTPSIKHVFFAVMSDTNTQMISLENGDIDVLINANIGALSKLQSDKVKWETRDASSIDNMKFNCNKGPASDINFRKAVQYLSLIHIYWRKARWHPSSQGDSREALRPTRGHRAAGMQARYLPADLLLTTQPDSPHPAPLPQRPGMG